VNPEAFDMSSLPAPPRTRRNVIAAPLVGVGGWLAFFIVVLVFFNAYYSIRDALFAVQDIKRLYAELPRVRFAPLYYFLDHLVWLALRAFGIYAGIQLWRIRPGAVEVAKRYLWCFAFVAFVQAAVPMSWWILQAHGSLSTVAAGHPDNQEALLSLIRPICYSLAWYSYLLRSVRVSNTYPAVISTQPIQGVTT
jgi:Protein of unknown function (DUF2569)